MTRRRSAIGLAGLAVVLLAACHSPATSSSPLSEERGAASSAVQTSDSIVAGPDLTVGGVIPEHGIAYRTASGTAVATYTGEVLFTMAGVHVVDRSRDSSTMAAVVAFDDDTGTPLTEYALTIGGDVLQPVQPFDDSSPYVHGWVTEGAPDGCVRDARRAGSPMLLCASEPNSGPTRLARADGSSPRFLDLTPVQPSGFWVDAIAGPSGYIAAMWSGECESLSSYLIPPDAQAIPLGDVGASAVLAWVEDDVLVSRFGSCGDEAKPTELLLINTDGTATTIPTPGIIEAPVAW